MQPKQLIEFLNIIGNLKTNTRHVWSENGRQESVAEHSWRLTVMALLIAGEFPDINMEKVIKMCLIHDFGEAITGDIPSFWKTQQDEEKEDLAITDLLQRLPNEIATDFTELFKEMAQLKTNEAKLFKALDKMEALVSHNESPLETWLELEYKENLIYGEEEAAHSDYLMKLREELKKETIRKIKANK